MPTALRFEILKFSGRGKRREDDEDKINVKNSSVQATATTAKKCLFAAAPIMHVMMNKLRIACSRGKMLPESLLIEFPSEVNVQVDLVILKMDIGQESLSSL